MNELVSLSYPRTHYGWDETKVMKLLELKLLESVIVEGKLKILKKSLEPHYLYEQNVIEKYIPAARFFERLGYSYQSYSSKQQLKDMLDWLSDNKFVEVLKLDGYHIQFHSVWVSISSINEFEEMLERDYIEHSKAVELYKDRDFYYFVRTNNVPFIKLRSRYYLKKSIEEFDLKGYITTSEAAKITGLSQSIIKSYKANTIFQNTRNINGRIMIPKQEALNVKTKIEELREQYYTPQETIDYLNVKQIHQKMNEEIHSIPCPPIARSFALNSSALYLKSDVHRYFNERIGANQKRFISGTPSDPIQYFMVCVEEQFPDINETTKELFSKYVNTKLSISNANHKTKMMYSETFLSLLKRISEFDNETAIQSFSTREAAELLNAETRKTHKWYLYDFLEFCTNKTICKFNLKKINKPNKSPLSSNNTDIYPFEVFTDIYNFSTEMDRHLKQALHNRSYSNTWLYVLMHLSNAWRNSDIMEIPPIFPEATNIFDLSWFQDNEMTKEMGQTIINQLSNFELVISKTGMKRHFFCNTDLIIPISTAMSICEFHRRTDNTPFLIKASNKSGTISEKDLSIFFSTFETEDKSFKFGSLKMNRSIMTHLYYSIQKKHGKGNSAFELIQKMRNHKSEITKDYIYVNSEEFGNLTKNIFDRGEFGFIYDQLVDVLSGGNYETKQLENRTSEIVKLKEMWNPLIAESFSGFIQSVESEKLSIINQIKKLNKEEAFEFIRKLYLEEMPSKENNVQCFSYPECHKPSRDFNCRTCTFSIPNIYALTATSQDIHNTINNCLSTSKEGLKKKYLKSLHHSLDILEQAINEFGEDFVWSFFENGEQGFEERLSLIR